METQAPATATLIGDLKWVSESLRQGCRAIAILVDGEKLPANAEGKKPLRGITLTRSKTELFDEMFGETVFIGDEISVTVRTTDLEGDLAQGVGTKGHPYFVGVSSNR